VLRAAIIDRLCWGSFASRRTVEVALQIRTPIVWNGAPGRLYEHASASNGTGVPGVFNWRQAIDALMQALHTVLEVFG
jgi:hypothetical protein